ncbi:MAG: hypothetical protein H6741_03650 [Alphaproteobacteria bacterium]|nr:hypothetical protein [Alphaproteobacteria bacterium]
MRITAISFPLFLVSCGAAQDNEAPAMEEIPDRFVSMNMDDAEMEKDAAPASPAPARAKKEAPRGDAGGEGMVMLGGALEEAASAEPEEAPMDGRMAAKPGAAEAGPSLRSWFPETFLWEPLVITDEAGQASLEVRVPDSLTTWRVLALAASREGAQAGDVYTFSSSLPVYVDPIVPQRLRVGDALELPVQVVNTTAEALQSQLSVSTAGLQGGASGTVQVAAYGTRVEQVRVVARQPGPATVTASLGGADAVRRELQVEPVGQKLTDSRSGILGSEDAVDMAAAPGAEYARARLVLFAGPLGLLRSELSSAGGRMGYGVAEQAFAFTLATEASAILSALGGDPAMADPEAMRALRLQAQQALVRSARGASQVEAAATLSAARHAPEDPVAERLATRMEDSLRNSQLPDGTWAVPSGSSVQLMMARTAWIAASTQDRGARVRASGAIERFGERMANPETGDAYTAALVIRSGLGDEALQARLRSLIEGAITKDGTGASRIKLPPGVQRPDGGMPSPAEVEALCAAALEGAPAKELAASLMARYQPGRGFGDGYASLAALEALALLGGGELPESMDVVLRIDGEEVERHTLRREAASETAVLTVPAPLGGSHRYELSAEGAWPGLAWHLDLDSWVPWEGGVGPEGLEIKLERGPLAKGAPVNIDLTAAGPEQVPLLLTAELPVGFVIDERSLVGGELDSIDEQRIVVRVPADHGGVAQVRFQAVPTLAGSLSTGPVSVALATKRELVATAPPQRWEVR